MFFRKFLARSKNIFWISLSAGENFNEIFFDCKIFPKIFRTQKILVIVKHPPPQINGGADGSTKVNQNVQDRTTGILSSHESTIKHRREDRHGRFPLYK